MILPPTLEPAHRDMIQIVALLWPAPLFLLRGTNQFVIGLAYRQSSALRYLTVVFVTAITISSALSINQTASFRYAAATISGFILCAGVWSCLKWRMQQALVAYAILSSGFCLYVYFRGESVWGRLTFGAMGHPNYLALVAFGALVCSLAVPFWTLRILLIAINGVVILETQARSCLIGSAVSLLVYLWCRAGSKRARVAIVTLASLMLIVAFGAFQKEITDSLYTLLYLHNRDRGIESGFTGRVAAWQEAYDIFKANPAFGIGLRQHEQFMTTLSSAHNGYLSMLADCGIAGLLTAIALIATCGWRLMAISRTGHRMPMIGLAFVSGYLFIAIFERYLINFGSPTALLVWIFLLMPHGRRRAVAQVVPFDRETLEEF